MTSSFSPRLALLIAAGAVCAGLGAGLATADDEPGTLPELKPGKMATTFVSILNGGQAVPATDSTAMGNGYFTLDRKTGTVDYSVAFSGLTGTITAVHVHAGTTGEVRKPHLFHLHGEGGSRVGTTVSLDKRVIKLLRRGQCYVNVHTDAFPDGEIRGQILPVKGVR